MNSVDLTTSAAVAAFYSRRAEQLVGIYATAVTAILVGAGMLFLFAMIRWYEVPLAPKQAKRKS